jgi:hemoglobin
VRFTDKERLLQQLGQVVLVAPALIGIFRKEALVAHDPTLFEWAGGRQAFDRLINAFYDRVEQDELLSPFFPGGVHGEHRENVATWWSEVFGGPADYTDQLGGYERMVHKHLRLGITDEQRFRFASLMSLAAEDAGLPDDPEFRSALVAYLEWGTPIALGNSAADAHVVAQAPVPRWGWGEAPPHSP